MFTSDYKNTFFLKRGKMFYDFSGCCFSFKKFSSAIFRSTTSNVYQAVSICIFQKAYSFQESELNWLQDKSNKPSHNCVIYRCSIINVNDNDVLQSEGIVYQFLMSPRFCSLGQKQPFFRISVFILLWQHFFRKYRY